MGPGLAHACWRPSHGESLSFNSTGRRENTKPFTVVGIGLVSVSFLEIGIFVIK